MATYYVEVYRTNCNRELGLRTHTAAAYSTDALSPGVRAVFCVEGCRRKSDAVAAVAEKAAGYPVTVYQVLPVRPRTERES